MVLIPETARKDTLRVVLENLEYGTLALDLLKFLQQNATLDRHLFYLFDVVVRYYYYIG